MTPASNISQDEAGVPDPSRRLVPSGPTVGNGSILICMEAFQATCPNVPQRAPQTPDTGCPMPRIHAGRALPRPQAGHPAGRRACFPRCPWPWPATLPALEKSLNSFTPPLARTAAGKTCLDAFGGLVGREGSLTHPALP